MILKALIITLLIPTVILSASFDCSKASTDIEKAICSNPQLNSLDSTLGLIWKNLIQKVSKEDIRILKEEQKYWVQLRNEKWKSNIDSLKLIYKKRINDLNAKLSAMNTKEPYFGTYIIPHEIQVFNENEYETQIATDYVKVNRISNGTLSFEIQLIGTNANECGASGDAILENDKYIWKDPDANSTDTCVLGFTIQQDTIVITNFNDSDCSYFCGAGLSIDQIILKKSNVVSDKSDLSSD